MHLHLKDETFIPFLTSLFPFSLQTLPITTIVLVLMAILNVTVETKSLSFQLNGRMKTVQRPREVLKSLLENNEIFKAVPDYTQISSDFARFQFIRDIYQDKCKTTIRTEQLSDAIVPVNVKKAVCTGTRCTACRCSPVKITYQLVKRTGINKYFRKQLNELIKQKVTVAFRPSSRSC